MSAIRWFLYDRPGHGFLTSRGEIGPLGQAQVVPYNCVLRFLLLLSELELVGEQEANFLQAESEAMTRATSAQFSVITGMFGKRQTDRLANTRDASNKRCGGMHSEV